MMSSTFYTVSQKNDTDITHYNFDVDQPILIILAEMLLREYAIKRWFFNPISDNQCLCATRRNMNPGNCVFSAILYIVSRKQNG